MAAGTSSFCAVLAMPHMTFALSSDGMIVPAEIALSAPEAQSTLLKGQQVPTPIRLRALIDTGADRTSVALHVFQQLGLAPLIPGFLHTAGGSFQVDLYRTSLTIFGPDGAAGPLLFLSDLLAAELTVPLAFDALIGLDVLSECLLIMDGPGQRFTLAF
jgi:hypothetical protein